jgi:hypothetical protein
MVNICNTSKEPGGTHRHTGFVLLSIVVAFEGPDLDIALDRSRVVFPTGQARTERWYQCRTRADLALVLDRQSMCPAYLSYARISTVSADDGGCPAQAALAGQATLTLGSKIAQGMLLEGGA